MKLSIEQSSENREVEIIVKCPYLDDELERLIAQIRLYSFTISGKKEGVSYILKPEDIFYFDSVDNKTFVYCAYPDGDRRENEKYRFHAGEQIQHSKCCKAHKSQIVY